MLYDSGYIGSLELMNSIPFQTWTVNNVDFRNCALILWNQHYRQTHTAIHNYCPLA